MGRACGTRPLFSLWKLAAATALAASLAATNSQALAQQYPSSPIRMVVPFPAGGGTDNVARIVAQAVSKKMGASIVIENKPGASGALGAETAARAEPDGYTVMLTNQGPVTIVPFLEQKLAYDVTRDFAPIALVGRQPALFVVNKMVPAKSLSELVALAKSKPGELNFGSPGVGSDLHVIAELLNAEAGIKIEHIPFRGGAPALNALLGGQIQMMVAVYSTVKPHLESGALRALATANPKRLAALPDVPTTAEAGLPRVSATPWWGLFAPAKTPDAILQKWGQTLSDLQADPEFQKQLANLEIEGVVIRPPEFQKIIQDEQGMWKGLLGSLSIKRH